MEKNCKETTSRFPTYQHKGMWSRYKLGDIAQLYKGKGISKNDVSDKGTTPCIRYGELYTHYKEIIDKVTSYTDLHTDDLFMSKANDVIIPSSGETKEDIATASCVLHDNVALGGDINVIRTSNNGVFLSYYLNNAKKHDIAKIAQGISIIHLYNEQLRNLSIELPDLEEQQKIAECLSSIDSYISSINEKVEQLKAHKKSLLQKLFPQKGKLIPDFRFSNYTKGKQWSVKKLNEIVGNIVTGKLDANAMVSNGQYRFYTCAKSFFYIDKYAFDTEALLISGNGANVGYIHYYKGKFNAYQRTYVLSDFKCDVFFLKYYLEYSLPERIKKEKKDGNTPYIVLSTLTEMPVLLPELLEQERISSCLLLIDKMIKSNTSKANWLEQHKEGLMQQLFPTSK